MNRTNFDFYAKSYENELNHALFPGAGAGIKYSRIKAGHLRRQLRRLFGEQPNPTLLDAGCGIGIADELLKPFFPRLAGFDVSSQSIRFANERNPEVHYKKSDGKTFPFENGEFDAVFAICVLHHLPVIDRNLFVSEAYRVLRPGGFFLVYEHNPWNLLTQFVVNRCSFDRDAILLSSNESRHLLKNGGFRSFKGGSLIYLPLENTVWQVWEERWLSKLPFGAQHFQIGQKPSAKETVKITS